MHEAPHNDPNIVSNTPRIDPNIFCHAPPQGRSPPPISDRTVDEETQPKEEEAEAPEGAPAPVPT